MITSDTPSIGNDHRAYGTSAVSNRGNPRFQVLDCRVQLKSNGILGFGKAIHHLSLIDLSATGLQVVSPKILDDRKEYDIAVLAPAFRGPISTKGHVVWYQPYIAGDQRKYYRVGLEFTYFRGDSMQKIEALEYNPKLRKIYKH